MKSGISGILAIVLIVVVATAVSAAKVYKIVDLSESEDVWNIPQDLSNRGQAVGSTVTTTGETGFVWEKGQTRWIDGTATCTAINNAGLMGGIFFGPEPGYEWPIQKAFLFDGRNGFVDLTVALGMPSGDHATNVYDINARGVVAGGGYIGGKWRGFVTNHRRNGYTVLPMTACSGINDQGQIVGNNLQRKPVVVEPDQQMTELPLPGLYHEAIYASVINNQGKVIGNLREEYMQSYSTRALLWQKKPNWQVLVISVLPGYTNNEAHDINSRGQVVGTCYRQEYYTPYHANLYLTPFLWERGRVTDLATICDYDEAVWVPTEAVAINDNGDILGTAINKQMRQKRAVIYKR